MGIGLTPHITSKADSPAKRCADHCAKIGHLINSDWCTELISFQHNQAATRAQCTDLQLGVKSRCPLMWFLFSSTIFSASIALNIYLKGCFCSSSCSAQNSLECFDSVKCGFWMLNNFYFLLLCKLHAQSKCYIQYAADMNPKMAMNVDVCSSRYLLFLAPPPWTSRQGMPDYQNMCIIGPVEYCASRDLSIHQRIKSGQGHALLSTR